MSCCKQCCCSGISGHSAAGTARSQVSHNCAKCASALSSHYASFLNSPVPAPIHPLIHHFIHRFVHHFIDHFLHHYFAMQLRQQSFQHAEGQGAPPSGLPQIQQPSMWARATATQPTCTETACQPLSAPRTVPGMCTGPGTWPGRACRS